MKGMAAARKARVAFFGGSFDPPHLGHLAVARAARDGLGLDQVLFAPVGSQPLKPRGAAAPFADRVAMTELAIAGQSGFALSLADAPNDSAEPNYTLDTLRRLHSELGAETALFCLMGADSLQSLREWHGAAEIPFAAALIVASRPGQELHDLAALLPEGLTVSAEESAVEAIDAAVEIHGYRIRNAGGESAAFYVLPGLDVEISASQIRAQLRGGEERAGGSVPPAVARYIREHGLYQ